jgi:hypothetical protein
MNVDAKAELDQLLATLATTDDIRELRRYMTICMERVRRDIHALIDAIELLKYIDSQPR